MFKIRPACAFDFAVVDDVASLPHDSAAIASSKHPLFLLGDFAIVLLLSVFFDNPPRTQPNSNRKTQKYRRPETNQVHQSQQHTPGRNRPAEKLQPRAATDVFNEKNFKA